MMSGLRHDRTRDKPQRVGSSANDIMGGMFAPIAIPRRAYQEARGSKRKAPIYASDTVRELPVFLGRPTTWSIMNDRPEAAPRCRSASMPADRRYFDTAGDDRIFIGVVTEGHWQSFCREFGLQEFSEDPTLATTTDRILARRGSFRAWPR